MSLEIAYTLGLAFLVSSLGIYLLWPAAVEYGLVDIPDKRKQHQGQIPLIGGVCIFLGVWATLLVPGVDHPSNLYIYLVILLIMGVADDFFGLSIGVRIFIQLMVALAVCLADDHLITYAGNIFGFGNIGANIFAIPITVLAIVTAVNAFNMIDGLDGLAASLALVTFSSLAVIFAINGMTQDLLVSLAFMAAIAPFLLANFPCWPFRKKIFMGDAGSVLIGFTIVWLLIEGSQPADRALPESRAFSPVTAMWIVGLPFFDLMSVCIRRLRRGQSPMSGDRDHIHHIILKHGFSHKDCLLTCILLELLLSLIGLFFDFIGLETLSFVFFWIFFLSYHFCLTALSGQSQKKTDAIVN